MMECAVELVGLKKSFRLMHGGGGSLKSLILSFRKPRAEVLWALKGIDLKIAKGETVAVIGKNGSGKSTTLGIIGNIYKPTEGSVTVHGRVSALLELGAGFHSELTGIENIYLNGAILGVRSRDMKNKIGEIVEFAELEKFIDAPIKSYSKGMVMRLGFAIAVQVNPDVLLVDEVLAVGDEEFQRKCYRKIEEFQRLGKTIVFVSHDLQTVRRVASRTVWIDDGLIRLDGSTEDVLLAYESEVSRATETPDHIG